jgi:hypothetical protein
MLKKHQPNLVENLDQVDHLLDLMESKAVLPSAVVRLIRVSIQGSIHTGSLGSIHTVGLLETTAAYAAWL